MSPVQRLYVDRSIIEVAGTGSAAGFCHWKSGVFLLCFAGMIAWIIWLWLVGGECECGGQRVESSKMGLVLVLLELFIYTENGKMGVGMGLLLPFCWDCP